MVEGRISDNFMLIGKGAEAYIYSDGKIVKKVRKRKEYREPELDVKLRKSRTKRESTAIAKCNLAGIYAPKLLATSEHEIEMEYIEGKRLSEIFESASVDDKKRYAREMGRMLAKMHGINLCHGDFALTNLILNDAGLHIIDFGLCEFSTYYEKMAADLAVMHSSLKDDVVFWEFVNEYAKCYKDAKFVIERFEKNLKRGRYKERV